MDNPQKRLKNIDQQISRILRMVDVHGLERPARDGISIMRQQLTEAQRYARDLAAAEFWNEKEDAAREIIERIDLINKYVLELSSYDVFGPTDVAQISAELDTIKSNLA